MINIEEIKSKYGGETALVVLICRVFFGAASYEDLNRFLLKTSISWEVTYKRLTAHEIRPLAFKVISGDPNLSLVPIFDRLKSDCLSVSYMNLQMLKETIRLHKLFESKNMTLVSYKGVTLSKMLFDDYAMREVCDGDFIVDYTETVNATNLLIEDGYKTDFYFKEADEEYVKKVTCERQLFKIKQIDLPFKIEMHWKLLQSMFDVPLSNETILKNVCEISVTGDKIKSLNIDYTLISLLCHHGVNDVWRSLKHIVDIAMFVKKFNDEIDWEIFNLHLKKLNISRSSDIGFSLVEKIFGICNKKKIHVAERNEQMVIRNLFTYPMISRLKYSPKNLIQHLSLRDSHKDRFRLFLNYVKVLIVPSADDLKYFKLPGKLFFLYYVLKPFRLIKNRLILVN